MSDRTEDQTLPTEEPKKVLFERNPFKDTRQADAKVGEDEKICLLMQSVEQVSDVSTDFKGQPLKGDKKHVNKHVGMLARAGRVHGIDNKIPVPKTYKGNWQQYLKDDHGNKISARVLRAGALSGSLSAQDAALRAQAAAELGTPIAIPLLSTGIWISIRSISDSARYDFYRQVLRDRIEYGTSTNSLVFDLSSTLIQKRLLTLILNHVIDTTAKSIDTKYLKSIIKTNDLPTIYTYAAKAIWMNGFDYHQPCMAQPNSCTYQTEGKIDVHATWIANDEAFSPKQKAWMLDQVATRDDEFLEKYRDEFLVPQTILKPLPNNETIKIKLSVPTVELFEQIGTAWIKQLQDNAYSILGEDVDDDDLDGFMRSKARLNTLMGYSHWVSGIYYYDMNGALESSVEDRDAINATLIAWSETDMTNDIFDMTQEFISESMVAWTGIPVTACPNCGGKPHKEKLYKDELIPLDPLEVFFTQNTIVLQKKLNG